MVKIPGLLSNLRIDRIWSAELQKSDSSFLLIETVELLVSVSSEEEKSDPKCLLFII